MVLGILILCLPASAARPQTIGPFERAERLRDALEGLPEQQRTRAEYNRVLDAFRAIYHGDPASPRADASISAVAGLLDEEGRVFQDAKSFNDAVAEYEFLRREYPGSRYRFSGLLTEGEIYRRDLGDRSAAESVFQTFLRLYPTNPLAEQARQELSEIQAEESAEKKLAAHSEAAARHIGRAASRNAEDASTERQKSRTVGRASDALVRGPAPEKAAAAKQVPASSGGGSYPVARPPNSGAMQQVPSAPANQPAVQVHMPVQQAATGVAMAPPSEPVAPQQSSTVVSAPLPRRGRLPLVTGVRHWSTPVYTRVAIDLQDEVQYEAARVPDPDRIFFDLHGACLSPELIGKSVQVTDDGFLKRIRVAQYSSDISRVVLDVSDVSDYSAFLLPNPYRLIIDIHGRKTSPSKAAGEVTLNPPIAAATTRTASGAASSTTVSPNANPPRSNAKDPRQATPAGAPKGSTYGVNTAAERDAAAATAESATTLQDVASLSRQPNRIKATRRPTTAPISASVAGTTGAPQPDGRATLSAVGAAGHASGRTQTTNPAQDSLEPARIHEADPNAGGGRSLSRALGLKIGRIVVDAGHGGHDSGTLGPGGIQEKDVVLDVALRLGKLLRQRLGADVIFTRDDDTFIPLETRTAIANKAQADLFISVHANSSQDPDARGVETYYLSFTSSADALEVAARENAVSQQSIHELANLVKKIALQDKIDESREFATDVERSLYNGLTIAQAQNAGLHDRGVKKAPFVVLIGANMPSILAEISFLTNPEDARQLRDPAYRQKIAESLYLGVARYVGGLSGVRLASNGRDR
ncbi:MAG TPA: N-acetylmuramoyl-L-alanine amidase [Acidisarcina sp.]